MDPQLAQMASKLDDLAVLGDEEVAKAAEDANNIANAVDGDIDSSWSRLRRDYALISIANSHSSKVRDHIETCNSVIRNASRVTESIANIERALQAEEESKRSGFEKIDHEIENLRDLIKGLKKDKKAYKKMEAARQLKPASERSNLDLESHIETALKAIGNCERKKEKLDANFSEKINALRDKLSEKESERDGLVEENRLATLNLNFARQIQGKYAEAVRIRKDSMATRVGLATYKHVKLLTSQDVELIDFLIDKGSLLTNYTLYFTLGKTSMFEDLIQSGIGRLSKGTLPQMSSDSLYCLHINDAGNAQFRQATPQECRQQGFRL